MHGTASSGETGVPSWVPAFRKMKLPRFDKMITPKPPVKGGRKVKMNTKAKKVC